MASDTKSILKIGFGGTLFYHDPQIHAVAPDRFKLKDWIWAYKPQIFQPTSRCGYFLIRAVKRFVEKYPELSGRLQIEIWGNIDPGNQRQVAAYGVGDIVKIEGYVQREASRLRLESCDVVFLPLELAMAGYKPLLIPGKVFEYLRVGKPILAIGQDSDAVDIVLRSGLGVVFHPDQIEEIADCLRYLVLEKDRLSSMYQPDKEYIDSFDFKNLSVQLAKLIDELLV